MVPPNPNAQDDPTEEELIGAADKLDTMMIESWCITGSVASGQTGEGFDRRCSVNEDGLVVECFGIELCDSLREDFLADSRYPISSWSCFQC